MLHRIAAGRRRAVGIGVHEGAAALVLVAGLPQGADLHLVDPFAESTHWWEPADEHAVKAVVGRAARRRGGPRIHWHVAASPDVASGWSIPLDLVFIDGDPARDACRLDWDAWSSHVRGGGVVAFHGAAAASRAPRRWSPSSSAPGPARLAHARRARHDRRRRAPRLARRTSPRSRSARAPGSRGSAAAGGDPRARPAGLVGAVHLDHRARGGDQVDRDVVSRHQEVLAQDLDRVDRGGHHVWRRSCPPRAAARTPGPRSRRPCRAGPPSGSRPPSR